VIYTTIQYYSAREPYNKTANLWERGKIDDKHQHLQFYSRVVVLYGQIVEAL
jgi:hypothetical protein